MCRGNSISLRAYFLALLSSDSLCLFNYRRSVCSIYCLLSPYFHLRLPNLISSIFQPSHSWSSHPFPPSGLLSYIILTILSWSILIACLISYNILHSISATISNSLYIRNFLMILISLSRFRRESIFVYLCACWPSINTLKLVVSFRSTVIVYVIK